MTLSLELGVDKLSSERRSANMRQICSKNTAPKMLLRQNRDVLKLVLTQGTSLTVIGVAVGVAGALALTRFLSNLLHGVKPTAR